MFKIIINLILSFSKSLNFSKFNRDILKDKNCDKFSLTKVLSMATFSIFAIYMFGALHLMITKQEVDHILVGELITLLLTLLGFKTFKPSSEVQTPSSTTEAPKEAKNNASEPL